MTNVLSFGSGLFILFMYFGGVIACPNGVWECTDQDSFRLCMNGNITSEVYKCPPNYYCCQNKNTICNANHDLADCIDSKANSTLSREIIKIAAHINCQNHGKVAIMDSGCRKYLLCNLTSQGFEGIQYTCPDGFFFNPQINDCSNSYICPQVEQTCLEAGNYPVVNSDCKYYRFCFLTSKGLGLLTLPCPDGTLFDPQRETCSTTHICLNSKPTDSLNRIESSRTTQLASTILSTTSSTIEVPVCITQGTFLVPNTNCKQYILCLPISYGNIGTIHNCPTGFRFNVNSNKCQKDFQCIDNNIVNTTQSSTITTITATSIEPFWCKDSGKFLIPNTGCKQFILCLLTNTGFNTSIYNCLDGHLFHSTLRVCVKMDDCIDDNLYTTESTLLSLSTITPKDNESSLVTHTPTMKDDASQELLCDKPGIFAKPGSNCLEYILCGAKQNGFIQEVYVCPTNTHFDPQSKLCSATCICSENTAKLECSTKITSSVTENTSVFTTIKQEDANQNYIFNCTTNGRFMYKNTDCEKYILCSKTDNGFVSAGYPCPKGFLFNPELQSCKKDYICPDIEMNKNVAKCTTVGKFAFDTNDSNCNKYLDCNTVDGINWNSEVHVCRNGSKFNPVLQQCSEYYSCTTILSSEDHGYVRIKRDTLTTDPRYLVNERCTTIGRYQVADSNCRKYLYCSALPNGTLQQTTFTCPTTTVFNQVIQKCTSTYQCPDTLCFYPQPRANPNTPDCSSYIECTYNMNNLTGIITGFRGTVRYCEPGCKFDPMMFGCSRDYQCPTA